MRIVPVPAREDNYMYLLISNSKKAAAVDPYDVPKLKAAAQQEGVELGRCFMFSQLVITHILFFQLQCSPRIITLTILVVMR